MSAAAGSGSMVGSGSANFSNADPTGTASPVPSSIGRTRVADASTAKDLKPGDECAGIDEMAKNERQPADIIIGIDSSSSMTAETMFVQMQLNAFSQRIIDAMVDVHVILIAERPGFFVGNPICVPPPLAGANCADNEPTFKQIDQVIGNHDAWDQIIATYPLYKHLLRPGAQKHLVVITDDSAGPTRTAFDQMLKALDPQFVGYRQHAIVAFSDGDEPSCQAPDPCCGKSEGDGGEYVRLADDTMGIKANLCLQDFEPVWNELAMRVATSAALACDWEIPVPPDGKTLDPMRVNVHLSGGGMPPKLLGWVDSSSACGMNEGWYYDDNNAPARVFACPQTCTTIKGFDSARIDIKFGCHRCAGLDADCGGEPPPAPPSVD